MCRHLFAEYESNRWTNRPCRTRRRSIFSSHKASRSNALQQRGTSECWQFVWDCHIHQTNPNRADQSVDFKCPQCGRVKRRNSLYCCVSKWQHDFKRSEKNITTDTFLSHFCWDGKRGQIWFCDLLRVLEKVTTNNTSKYETTGTSSLWAAADGHSPAEQKHLKKTSFQRSLLNLQGSNCEFYSVILVRNT